eukprot:scaffold22408_cov52-Phaeocystis_antarctica.AAC.1
MNTAVAHTVPAKVVAGAAALALSSLLLLYRRRRRSAPAGAASPAAPAAPTPAKAPPRRETLTVELRDLRDDDLLTDSSREAAPEPVELRGGAALPEELVRLWRDERLCDVHLHAGPPGAESSHVAHRVVLAAQSAFLGRLLSENAPGTKAPPAHLRLTHLSSEACDALLAFAYRGSCVVATPALLVQLLHAAAQLRLDVLRDAAAAAIGSLLAPASCLRAWSLAQAHGLHTLANPNPDPDPNSTQP